MKRSSRLLLALTCAGLCLLFTSGCKKENASVPSTKPVVSVEKNSFKEVTSQLDPGGSLYLYLSTEQFLSDLSQKVAALRPALLSIPNLDSEQQANLGRALDLVTNLMIQSGVQDVSGFGMSSVTAEPGFYHTKSFLHHYPGKGRGFLWNILGQQAHALAGLEMLPTNTAMAIFSDADLPLVWSVIQKQATQSGFPQAQAFLEKFPGEFQKATGVTLASLLDSLGGEYGLVMTLDSSKMIPVPLPTSQPLTVPEPGLAIVIKVKDDTIFNRIDQELGKKGQQLIRVDKPNLKMRTMSLPLPLPLQLRPTIASSKGYLFIATTDALIQEMLAIKDGQHPGLKSTEEFKHVANNIPEEGNRFVFVSARFGQMFKDIQQTAMQMKPNAPQQLIQSLFNTKPGFCYSVGANTSEGWFAVANSSRSPTTALVAVAAVGPAVLAGIAIPNFVRAREVSQRNACINNLRQLDAAKQQWALETGKTGTSMPAMDDLRPYLNGRIACPAGGYYTLRSVAEPPTCSISGHTLQR